MVWIFIGGENIKLFKLVNDFLSEYWKKEDMLIEYLLIDYVIYMAYQKIPDIKKIIDKNEFNNKDIYVLNSIKNNKYNEKFANELLRKNKIHKLTYKDKTDLDKENTYYKKIIKTTDKVQ